MSKRMIEIEKQGYTENPIFPQSQLQVLHDGLGQRRAMDLQNLHDTHEFWTETGISEAGHKRAEQLREKWSE